MDCKFTLEEMKINPKINLKELRKEALRGFRLNQRIKRYGILNYLEFLVY